MATQSHGAVHALSRQRMVGRLKLARPKAAAISNTFNIDHFPINRAMAQIRVRTNIRQSRVAKLGLHKVSGPTFIAVTVVNRTCKENHTDRLRMTPTTAAVMPASAPLSRG